MYFGQAFAADFKRFRNLSSGMNVLYNPRRSVVSVVAVG
jgi:hypothetical protein